MCLALGVDEVLDLGHGEFADADEPTARRDFIAVRCPDLRDGHGHTAIVEVVQSAEVNEHALRRFRAQKTSELPRRPNMRRKHEVEWKRLREVRARRGRFDFEFHKQLVELRGLVCVSLRSDLAKLVAAL